jgi:hypothetical protein
VEVNCVVLGARPVDSGYAAVDLPQQLLLLSRPRTFIEHDEIILHKTRPDQTSCEIAA